MLYGHFCYHTDQALEIGGGFKRQMLRANEEQRMPGIREQF